MALTQNSEWCRFSYLTYHWAWLNFQTARRVSVSVSRYPPALHVEYFIFHFHTELLTVWSLNHSFRVLWLFVFTWIECEMWKTAASFGRLLHRLNFHVRQCHLKSHKALRSPRTGVFFPSIASEAAQTVTRERPSRPTTHIRTKNGSVARLTPDSSDASLTSWMGQTFPPLTSWGP